MGGQVAIAKFGEPERRRWSHGRGLAAGSDVLDHIGTWRDGESPLRQQHERHFDAATQGLGRLFITGIESKCVFSAVVHEDDAIGSMAKFVREQPLTIPQVEEINMIAM
jgi:hypothetical protein